MRVQRKGIVITNWWPWHLFAFLQRVPKLVEIFLGDGLCSSQAMVRCETRQTRRIIRGRAPSLLDQIRHLGPLAKFGQNTNQQRRIISFFRRLPSFCQVTSSPVQKRHRSSSHRGGPTLQSVLILLDLLVQSSTPQQDRRVIARLAIV